MLLLDPALDSFVVLLSFQSIGCTPLTLVLVTEPSVLSARRSSAWHLILCLLFSPSTASAVTREPLCSGQGAVQARREQGVRHQL